MDKKKGQISITFNWVYILIAGAIILLFFVGLVVKQQAVSEQNLASEVVRVMESIFTGAGVSEKTKNFIDTSGLSDYTLYFGCEEGTSEFGIVGKSTPSQNVIDPIFAPSNIRSSHLILWSLPYKLPFKTIDFLFVTSSNTKYFLLGNDPFAEEFINATDNFNRLWIQDLSMVDPGKNFQIRIVDLEGIFIEDNTPVPEKVKYMQDDRVTAVSFTGTNLVDFYQKNGLLWKKTNSEPVQIISLGGERDAAKYAAIFSDDEQSYMCNMQKAFKRLDYLLLIYEQKAQEIEKYYLDNPNLQYSSDCLNYVQISGYEPNVNSALESLKNNVAACTLKYDFCTTLIGSAQDLQKANKDLSEKGDCLTLY